MIEALSDPDQEIRPWQTDVFNTFGTKQIAHVAYVPDGGHKGLINLCRQSDSISTSVLTTEEEGIGLVSGLWLGGIKSALLMQSSGVGNCVNMFSLAENCRIPLVMLITMRGEWAEFVPWQIPMGKRTPDVLSIMDVDVYRATPETDVTDMVDAAIDHAYFANRRVAVLLSQQLIGRKNWSK